MAIIKCKMCGGDLRIEEGSTVCECEYCGTRQTVPSADNEKKLTLFSRAGRLLRGCEFDKAAGVFETIVADFPEEAEAYWGLVLCKYGIEYVDDPATGKKIPTCHRSSFESVLDDPNFEQACENTDAIARRVYRDEARQIEELRKQIIEVSGKEEPYDIFISYKETDEHGDRTLDSVIAQDIYTELTEKGYRVFFSRISLEDKLGTEYEPYIFAALNSAKVMLVVGTDYENFDSVWVKNEWSRFLKLIASGQKKTLIPVFKNMDAYDMPKEFAKLAAQDMGKVGAMQDLVRGVEKLISKKSDSVPVHQPQQVVVQQSGGPNVTALLERGKQALEDAEFEKARGFYDQVLNMDAKNADAFLGLFLANNSCVNEDAYIAKACSKIGTAETLNIATDQARINEAVKVNSLERYLDVSEIRRLFVYDTGYPSTVNSQQKIVLDEKRNFESDRYFARAFRFASGETAARLNSFKDKLYTGLDKTVENAKAQADSARKKKQHDYEAFLADAEEKAIDLRSAADAKKESEYINLVVELEKAANPVKLASLRDNFLVFGDYKDAQAMAHRCDEKIAEIEKAEAEEAERKRIEKEQAARKRRRKKQNAAIAVAVVVALAATLYFSFTKLIIPSHKYKQAETLLESGNKTEAGFLFGSLGNYRDAKVRSAELLGKSFRSNIISAGNSHTVAVKKDGTVVAVGRNSEGQCNVSDWSNIVSAVAGGYHTVGLIADGRVVATGRNSNKQCNIGTWSNIIMVAAGNFHTIGLKADGTANAVGYNSNGQCNVSSWRNMVAICAGGDHTVGLKADGTVVAVGDNASGQCNVSGWEKIVSVAAGGTHTVALNINGKVSAAGANTFGQCNVGDWKNIIAIAATDSKTYGLKEDGTVIATGQNNAANWRDITAIAACGNHIIGLKSDGTVVATGSNNNGECNVGSWSDIAQ